VWGVGWVAVVEGLPSPSPHHPITTPTSDPVCRFRCTFFAFLECVVVTSCMYANCIELCIFSELCLNKTVSNPLTLGSGLLSESCDEHYAASV